MKNPNEPVSKKLYLLILALLVTVAITTVIFTPILPSEFQSVASSTVGSIVGTALAFLGAVWLWAKEQRKLAADEAEREFKLVTEEIERKRKERIERKQSRDKELLREAHVAIGSLIAFNYNDQRLDTASINLQKRLLEMKLSQNAALLHDETLREECHFINEIASEDSDLQHYLTDGPHRLSIAHTWYLKLITLEPGASVVEARPTSYPSLKKAMDAWHEYLEEQFQARMEWEEEEEDRTKKKAAANGAKNK